jgi:hypothetical protein
MAFDYDMQFKLDALILMNFSIWHEQTIFKMDHTAWVVRCDQDIFFFPRGCGKNLLKWHLSVYRNFPAENFWMDPVQRW